MIVSADLLNKFGIAPATASVWAGPLTAACLAQSINTAPRIAGLLANVLHETGNLTALTEGMNYSSDALLVQWPSHFDDDDAQRLGRTAAHPADQRGIAERAYGGRYGNRAEGSGDGWLYRGHGAMQTTFYANYLSLAKATGWTRSISDLPAYLVTPDGASPSAAVFWNHAGCNVMLDAGQITRARVTCNGGGIGLDDVLVRFGRIRALLG